MRVPRMARHFVLLYCFAHAEQIRMLYLTHEGTSTYLVPFAFAARLAFCQIADAIAFQETLGAPINVIFITSFCLLKGCIINQLLWIVFSLGLCCWLILTSQRYSAFSCLSNERKIVGEVESNLRETEAGGDNLYDNQGVCVKMISFDDLLLLARPNWQTENRSKSLPLSECAPVIPRPFLLQPGSAQINATRLLKMSLKHHCSLCYSVEAINLQWEKQ